MEVRCNTPMVSPHAGTTTDQGQEAHTELDEPPDDVKSHTAWPQRLAAGCPNAASYIRRESLLTLQLHSEAEQTDDDVPYSPPRGRSIISNPSTTTSTAELTSDDGHSVASPPISPPHPPQRPGGTLPVFDQSLAHKAPVGAHLDMSSPPGAASSEETVGANLGRKRCITFACKPPKAEATAKVPARLSEVDNSDSSSTPKRRTTLKFACPTRAGAQQDAPASRPSPKRQVSPPPLAERCSPSEKVDRGRPHRDSDSTVTHNSPQLPRKIIGTAAKGPVSSEPVVNVNRRVAEDSDSPNEKEALRFHEFATSDEEQDDWVQESTCYSKRLTVDDVFAKEHIIRKACEEAEEEAEEDEDQDEDDDQDNEDDEDDDEDDAAEDEDEASADINLAQAGKLKATTDVVQKNQAAEKDEESDDGFHSDDEHGFANTDSEGEDSEHDWWRPGPSTAATSIEHLDRLHSPPPVEPSPVGSASSAHLQGHSLRRRMPEMRGKTAAVTIQRPPKSDLPDSADFVCGTLDEDRPLEQAYINRMRQRKAKKRGARPQDIDPTFPTSCPEDDDDDDDPGHSDTDDLMHERLDEIHGTAAAKTKKGATAKQGRKITHRSPPPPPSRHPAPKARQGLRIPPAPLKRGITCPAMPRRLFDQDSTRPLRSPVPPKRMMTSPPNSPAEGHAVLVMVPHLAGRPRLEHTSSLPDDGLGFTLSHLVAAEHDADGSDVSDSAVTAVDVAKRGAIDIFKGLEKKRQHRKEKLYQKMCAKQAAKGEKPYRVKPGRGAQRMREVGLQLQEHHGRAEHILSL